MFDDIILGPICLLKNNFLKKISPNILSRLEYVGLGHCSPSPCGCCGLYPILMALDNIFVMSSSYYARVYTSWKKLDSSMVA